MKCAERLSDLLLQAFEELEVTTVDRTAEYLVNHGVIVPPVSIGQSVYIISHKKVRELEVESLHYFKDRGQFTAFEFQQLTKVVSMFNYDDIDNYVFLTKDAAKEALERWYK